MRVVTRTANEILTEIDALSRRQLPLVRSKNHAQQVDANIRRMAQLHTELQGAQHRDLPTQQSVTTSTPVPTRDDLVGATEILIHDRWIPITRLNAKSVTVLWGNPGNQERELVPFRRIEGWR